MREGAKWFSQAIKIGWIKVQKFQQLFHWANLKIHSTAWKSRTNSRQMGTVWFDWTPRGSPLRQQKQSAGKSANLHMGKFHKASSMDKSSSSTHWSTLWLTWPAQTQGPKPMGVRGATLDLMSRKVVSLPTQGRSPLVIFILFSSVQFTQSCLTLCDPMNCSMPVHHQLPESTQTHVHWVSDAIRPSQSPSSPSPPALNLSQHQGLFKWVSSLHPVAKVLEFLLKHQSFQWTPRTDLL